MITQEFLDEFNKSELGKFLRLKYFECSAETLEEANKRLNKNYSYDTLKKYLKNTGLISKVSPIIEFAKENNEFVFDLENIKNLKDSDIILMSSCFRDKKFPVLDKLFCEFVKEIGTKKLIIMDINDSFSVEQAEQLPIEELTIMYGNAENVDLSKFHDLKKIQLRNVALTDLSSLNIPEDIESLSIYINENNPKTSLIDIKRFKKLRELSLEGALPSDNELINLITSLSLLENLKIDLKEENGKKSINSSELVISDEDLPDFLDLSNLKNVMGLNSQKLNEYLLKPKVTSSDELRKVSSFNYFNKQTRKRIFYSAREPIDPKILERLGDVELIVTSPLVFDDNFFQNYHRAPNIKIQIDQDAIENYELPELSAINDVMKQILGGISKEASDFEKVAYIYKKIGEMVYYDRTGNIGGETYIEGRSDIVGSLKGGLIENKLVCRGYSLVLKKFLDELRN